MKTIIVNFLLTASMLLHTTSGQKKTSCAFHLCTAELLQCTSSRLHIDEHRCETCQCAETTQVQNRSCPLHGCTTNLLMCVGGLRRRSDGCQLCECDEEGVLVNGSTPPAPSLDVNSSNNQPSRVYNNTYICPQIDCDEDLDCKRLKQSPITGCPVCECDENADTIDLCPKFQDIISTEGVTRGDNRIVTGSDIAKYKLSLGKLKKGFTPGQAHRVTLKALDSNFPFKEFLLELRSTESIVKRSKRRGRERTRTMLAASMQERIDIDGRIEEVNGCGTGYWTVDESSRAGRPFPACATCATETNQTENKLTATLVWVAPQCGCVYIRASVIDHTGSVVYYDHEDMEADNETAANARSRVSSPLYRFVCAKTQVQSRKIKSSKSSLSKKNKPGDQKNLKAIECCEAAQRQNPLKSKCEKRANAHARAIRTKFDIVRRTCKAAYNTCCLINIASQDEVGHNRQIESTHSSSSIIKSSQSTRSSKKNKHKRKGRRSNQQHKDRRHRSQ